MYASHFGLSKRLFRGNPHGSDVFVGPQTATVMSAVKKALAAEDAVITVSGPVGVGKTTIVRRALESIGANRIVIAVGRMHLGHDEVIELLLAGLGARQLPKSMVHRFAMFRRQLQQYSEKGTRVFIVVEDATRVGLDALSELEALTAEDSGASAGASLVLMGTEGIAELLRTPELVRLKQRVRLRQVVKPLATGELQGYLKHCFRVAGGNFDTVFEAGCGDALHRLSDGIPRLANNIIEQALNTAAEQDLDSLSVSFVRQVAAEEIGLTAEHSVADLQEALKQSADAENRLDADGAGSRLGQQAALDVGSDAPAPSEEAVSHAELLAPAADSTKESGPVQAVATADDEPAADDENHAEILPPAAGSRDDHKAVDAVPAVEPTARAETDEHGGADIAAGKIRDDDEIPDLIQDTLPDLEVLVPETAAADTQKTELESLFADDDGDLPTLFSSQRLESSPSPAAKQQANQPAPKPVAEATPPVAAEASGRDDEVPAWERDPTLAELRPDLEALERAMAVAQGLDDDAEPEEPVARDEEDIPELVPEITLDREIQAKIDEATEALKQTYVDLEPAQPASEDQSVEASLAPSEKVEPIRPPAAKPATAAEPKAKPKAVATPEVKKPKIPSHFKDTGELKRVASGLAEAKSLDDVDDKMAETLFGEEFSMAAAEIAASVAASKPANDELQLVDETPRDGSSRPNGKGDDVNGHELPRAPKRPASGKAPLDPKASERLATVRALNNGATPAGAPPSLSRGESIVMAEGTSSGRSRKPEELPLSIEDQINSATQTLKTLKIPSSALADNDDDDKPKGGFFSRFKRS